MHIREDIPDDQRWFQHPEIQARIAQAEAEFREGRCTYAETPEEVQRFLDSLKDETGRGIPSLDSPEQRPE